ncbi:MAG: tRNA (N6-isopentenyl adenosine(37)-C2)-methylthiotransferase MiaB [Eubacteriaceae bacterium]|nr:tRNA (N6-isopentenyl adenosine(37)-C2)-methylthiotransferase MiaB [Eubacteriaceae bacterium]
MNENDSEKIAGMLEAMGYKKAGKPSEADVAVLNTCSVRENADDRFFGHLGIYKALKNENPNMALAVCGCMMQQGHIVDQIKSTYPYVDIIFGTHNISAFPELLESHMQNRDKQLEILSDGPIAEGLPMAREFSHKAYVTIMNGCDNYCSYCIVPMARGREKSRPSSLILEEIEGLARQGTKEIMLLGQNVNSYGIKPGGEISFAALLSKAAQVPGIERIRFMTSHPKDFSDDILDVMSSYGNICKSVHLPMQSGSTSILKAMNRQYTQESYLGLVKKIRSRLKRASISTDIIVGFPGETEEDFEHTLNCIKEAAFESAFTFQYSPRRGTRSFGMLNTVPHKAINDRFARLTDMLHRIMLEKAEGFVGSTEKVLIEGASSKDSSLLTGRTDSNKLVNFTGSGAAGEMVSVNITKAQTFYLVGNMV